MVSEKDLEDCRADESLVEMQYGWMDFATYKGWRAYHAECHVCHGPDAMGSTYAPSLMDITSRRFVLRRLLRCYHEW